MNEKILKKLLKTNLTPEEELELLKQEQNKIKTEEVKPLEKRLITEDGRMLLKD